MTSVKDLPEKLQPFAHHGLELNSVVAGSAKTDCPFCGKPGHFGVSVTTGQFRCVRCETTGNIYSFLERLWKESVEETLENEYLGFAENRGCSIAALKHFGICRSKITGEWIVPAHNIKGKFANLNRFVEVQATDKSGVSYTKYVMYGTPTCGQHPLGTIGLLPQHKTRYLTEGLRDALLTWDHLQKYVHRGTRAVPVRPGQGESQHSGVWAAPSAGNFQADWLAHMDGCDNIILFDNDYPKVHPQTGKLIMQGGEPLRPGWLGQKRILSFLPKSEYRPTSVQYICWGQGDPPFISANGGKVADHKAADGRPAVSTPGHEPNLPDGYDMGDLFRDRGASALLYATQFLQTYKAPPRTKAKNVAEGEDLVNPLPRSSFAELCKDYEQRLHFSDGMKRSLAVMLSTVISTPLPEDPFWLKIIGPPGSGKTTLAEAISAARKWVYPMSKLTGFHSGYVDLADKERDNSLFPLIQGKTVVVKDADTLIKSSSRDTVMSELRDIFDGDSRSNYRVGNHSHHENLRIGFLICGTDALRALSRDTYLGERFLDCEILDDYIDPKPIMERARTNAWSSFERYFSPKEESADHESHTDDNTLFLKQVTCGYVNHMMENLRSMRFPTIKPEQGHMIDAMAEFLSYMRARVQRVGEDMSYRPRVEIAGRLSKQFSKLTAVLSVVQCKDAVDEEVLSTTRKVSLDTAKSFQLDITKLLMSNANGLDSMQIRHELQLPETTIRKVMRDMQELRIIKRMSVPNNSGQRGRNSHVWRVSDYLSGLWHTAHDSFPSNAPLPRGKHLAPPASGTRTAATPNSRPSAQTTPRTGPVRRPRQ